jgi:hypothetical protein
MNKEQIDNLIEKMSDDFDPNDPCDVAKFKALDTLRDLIIENDVPVDFSTLPKEAQEVMRAFAWYDTEDNIRQAARHEFARITHDVTPDAEAGASLMEDAFINLLSEAKEKND